jgi:hypothetical protein
VEGIDHQLALRAHLKAPLAQESPATVVPEVAVLGVKAAALVRLLSQAQLLMVNIAMEMYPVLTIIVQILKVVETLEEVVLSPKMHRGKRIFLR